jgi:tetratricopeptide (TPR) repeat protein
MKPESIVLAVAGTFFGILVGWVIGTQQVRTVPAAVAPAAVAAPQGQQPAAMPAAQAPRPLDAGQVQALTAAAQQNASDAQPRIQLGNLYFDAEQYADAVKWYEAALALAPKNADVSTDLAVSFYYMNQADRALDQFKHSLEIDPKHAKTLLNQGIVQAFGKQDLQGAAASWQKVIDFAPNSPEAATAKKALDGLKSAHPNMSGAPGV